MDMTGFWNDLVKRNVPIGSGLTKCVDLESGLEFLLGLHKALYLENNVGSLLSMHQAREAEIWLCDTLVSHGGIQGLIAPIKNSEKLIDLKLFFKDSLFSVECKFPSEIDIEELRRVWLTGNEFPWNPNIFEDKESTRVPTCWDGVS